MLMSIDCREFHMNSTYATINTHTHNIILRKEIQLKKGHNCSLIYYRLYYTLLAKRKRKQGILKMQLNILQL